MKRIAAFLLLGVFSIASIVPAQAQRLNNEQSARQNRKAGKLNQKMARRSVKQQRKAEKRSLKAQRKANKKANRELQRRRAGR